MARWISGLCLSLLALALGASAQNAGPGTTGIDGSDVSIFRRPIDNAYPVSEHAHISIDNRFGPVLVRTWDNPLVRLRGRIEVGAENRLLAEEFGHQIEVTGNHLEDRLELRTEFPAQTKPGIRVYTVILEVTIPRGASVSVNNQYGDIRIEKLDGTVTIRSQFGAIELRNVTGPVNVNARGEFPLTAERLTGGGVFTLRSTQARFEGLSGTYTINNYLGSVDVRSSGAELQLDVTSESGPVNVHVPAEFAADIEASSAFGTIESDIPLEREAWGSTVLARQPVPEAAHRYQLHASFAVVSLHQEGVQAQVQPVDTGGEGRPFTDRVTESHVVPHGAVIELDAIVGNVRIEGTEKNELTVHAVKTAWVTRDENAKLALQGLALRHDARGDTLTVMTTLQENMEAIGCTDYRVDLEIQYPRSSPLRVVTADGETVVIAPGPEVVIEQHAGRLEVREGEGKLRLINHQGDILVEDIQGDVSVTAQDGTVTARKVQGPLDITTESGRALVESPGDSLSVHTTDGDVRVIALEGVRGDFDITTERGNISVAVPDTADASFFVSTQGGTVFSKYELLGSVERDNQKFQSRLNKGIHDVRLEAQGGNITID